MIYAVRDGTGTIQGSGKPSGWIAVDNQTSLPIVRINDKSALDIWPAAEVLATARGLTSYLVHSMDPYLRHNQWASDLLRLLETPRPAACLAITVTA
jgi:hypothetical protein